MNWFWFVFAKFRMNINHQQILDPPLAMAYVR